MIRFILYKMLICESIDIDIFKEFLQYLIKNKDLDETYDSSDFYWYFHQLGKLGEVKLSLIRWEVWSSWKNKESQITLNPAYIGASCGLFFYNPINEYSWNSIKTQIETFLSKQKRDIPIFLVIALFDSNLTKEKLLERNDVKEQISFINNKKGDILFIPSSLKSNIQKLFDGFCSYFIKKLDKKLASEFNLEKEMKWLDLFNLRHLLIAEKQGWTQEKLDEFLRPKAVISTEEVWEMPEQKIQIPLSSELKIIAENNKIEVKGNFKVINPAGQEEIISNPDQATLVQLDMKGYKLPEILIPIIPRYCPKCGNFNQRMIFERMDKNHILLDYPRIYALKTVCGNCGCEWDQNSRKILHYKRL